MWGYIVFCKIIHDKYWVPSLYVRVYRCSVPVLFCILSSLTICEGISLGRIIYRANLPFPHYMWGYIALPRASGRAKQVPSLYVRVYRTAARIWTRKTSSLTICEGISADPFAPTLKNMFPHYMWGYIATTLFDRVFAPVPSLYVRVYRNIIFDILPFGGSLTICEGISQNHKYHA